MTMNNFFAYCNNSLWLDSLPAGKRSAIALLVENQKLFNSQSPNGDDSLIDLLKKVYSETAIWDWVSVQPLMGPAGFIYYTSLISGNITVESREVYAGTMRRDIKFEGGVTHVGDALIREIENEVLKDLWNNCGKVGCCNLRSYNHNVKCFELRSYMRSLMDEMAFAIKEPNFIVVKPDIYRRYKSAFFDLGVGLNTYLHEGVPGILFGYKGRGNTDSGYVYAPYVPFSYTPTLDGGKKLLSRHGKKLLEPRYYARATVFDEENS